MPSNSVDNFEYTRECAVFDLLKIRLFHGWVVDENDREILQLIKSSGSSYNQLVEMLVQYKNSNDDESLRKGEVHRTQKISSSIVLLSLRNEDLLFFLSIQIFSTNH